MATRRASSSAEGSGCPICGRLRLRLRHRRRRGVAGVAGVGAAAGVVGPAGVAGVGGGVGCCGSRSASEERRRRRLRKGMVADGAWRTKRKKRSDGTRRWCKGAGGAIAKVRCGGLRRAKLTMRRAGEGEGEEKRRGIAKERRVTGLTFGLLRRASGRRRRRRGGQRRRAPPGWDGLSFIARPETQELDRRRSRLTGTMARVTEAVSSLSRCPNGPGMLWCGCHGLDAGTMEGRGGLTSRRGRIRTANRARGPAIRLWD